VNRIDQRFAALRTAGRKALIPYITAGDPEPSFTVLALHALVKAGADILEVGVPFSDPMADGPVIQKANERALAHSTSLRKVLAMVKQFRVEDTQTPIVLMGYLNPIEALGYPNFVQLAQDAGVDGVLTVDMPPEESEPLLGMMQAADIAPIFLLAPNSSPARIARMSELGSGYLY
jgi:tryptophan synthase alpha chain